MEKIRYALIAQPDNYLDLSKMNTITLSVVERELLKTLLPQQGGRILMTLVKSLKEELDFTPEEIDQFELRDAPNGAMIGNPIKFKDRIFELSAAAIALLKPIPDQLNEAEKVTIRLLPLLDKLDELKA